MTNTFLRDDATFQPVTNSAFWNGGTTAGSANAQTVAAISGFTLTSGILLGITAGFTNTSAMTLQVGSGAVVNVFKRTVSGPIATSGNEVIVNDSYLLRYDGTQWELLDRVYDLYSVKDFGCKGDGVTDDTTNFQTALNAGFPLYAPAGTYIISGSSGLTISSNDQVLVGVGGTGSAAMTSTIKQNTLGAFVLQVTGSSCVIGNLGLTYASPATSGSALFASGCLNNVYYNLNITNIKNGIDSHAENVAFYTNILITGNATANTGFYLNGTLNLCISNAVFASTGAGTGILMDGPSEGNNFYAIEVFNWQTGLFITNDSGSNTGIAHVPWSNRFWACYFDDTQHESAINYGYDIEFTNCYFASIWNGVTVGGTGSSSGAVATTGQTDTIVFTGTSFNGCGANGIALVGTGSANTGIVNCQAYNNGTTVTGDGIHVFAGTTDFRIVGCLAKNTSRTNFGGSTQRNGITVDSGSSDRYIIAFNNVGPNGSSTNGNTNVGVSDSGAGANKTVTGNF